MISKRSVFPSWLRDISVLGTRDSLSTRRARRITSPSLAPSGSDIRHLASTLLSTMKSNGCNLFYGGAYPSLIKYLSTASGALDLENVIIVPYYLPAISAFKVHCSSPVHLFIYLFEYQQSVLHGVGQGLIGSTSKFILAMPALPDTTGYPLYGRICTFRTLILFPGGLSRLFVFLSNTCAVSGTECCDDPCFLGPSCHYQSLLRGGELL